VPRRDRCGFLERATQAAARCQEVAMQVDRFDADHLMSGIVVTVAVALALVLAPSPVAVPVLVALAFACGRLGGRDAGIGSAAAGTFMFGWAITEPHFVWEMSHGRDEVLFVVLLLAAFVASEVAARLRLRALRRDRSGRLGAPTGRG
jgi:K+-sensing histidine kinase KdpD